MGGELVLRWCADCRQEQPFEVPPCEDGHGADCPDLACAVCGAAVVVGVLLTPPAVLAHPSAA